MMAHRGPAHARDDGDDDDDDDDGGGGGGGGGVGGGGGDDDDDNNNDNNNNLSVFQCYTGCRFAVAFRHICRFIASSDVKFLYFITLSTSPSHYASGCPRPSGDQVIIRLGHLLLPWVLRVHSV